MCPHLALFTLARLALSAFLDCAEEMPLRRPFSFLPHRHRARSGVDSGHDHWGARAQERQSAGYPAWIPGICAGRSGQVWWYYLWWRPAHLRGQELAHGRASERLFPCDPRRREPSQRGFHDREEGVRGGQTVDASPRTRIESGACQPVECDEAHMCSNHESTSRALQCWSMSRMLGSAKTEIYFTAHTRAHVALPPPAKPGAREASIIWVSPSIM